MSMRIGGFAGGDAEVTIQLEPKLSNPDMQDEILKEWDKIAKRDSQGSANVFFFFFFWCMVV